MSIEIASQVVATGFFTDVQGMPTANDMIFAVSVVVGAFFHYLKKIAKKETKVSLREWFGSKNLPGTLMSFGGLGLAILAVLATNMTDGLAFYALIYSGLTTGFTIDSGLNSDGSAKEKADAVADAATEAAPKLKKAVVKKV